jgi:ribosomal protein S18 acetylase RimI-like enzyme
VKIRPATRADLPDIAALHIQSWRDVYVGILPAAFLNAPLERELTSYWSDIAIQRGDLVLVAESDNLCGFIAVWCRPTPYIDNLHVNPSRRSKTIGTTLLASAAQELMAQGHTTAYLWVFERNQKAVRFYMRMGGVITAKKTQDIFGYSIPSLKVEWSDLAIIGRNC